MNTKKRTQPPSRRQTKPGSNQPCEQKAVVDLEQDSTHAIIHAVTHAITYEREHTILPKYPHYRHPGFVIHGDGMGVQIETPFSQHW